MKIIAVDVHFHSQTSLSVCFSGFFLSDQKESVASTRERFIGIFSCKTECPIVRQQLLLLCIFLVINQMERNMCFIYLWVLLPVVYIDLVVDDRVKNHGTFGFERYIDLYQFRSRF